MPPLGEQNSKTFSPHRIDEDPSISVHGLSQIRRSHVSPIGKIVVVRAHIQRDPFAIYESQVHCDPPIMPRSLSGMSNVSPIAYPIPHEPGHGVWSVTVPDLQTQALSLEESLNTCQTTRNVLSHQASTPIIDALTEEIVGGGVTDVVDDSRRDIAQIDESGGQGGGSDLRGP